MSPDALAILAFIVKITMFLPIYFLLLRKEYPIAMMVFGSWLMINTLNALQRLP